jgi:hypothetical protein
MALLQRYVPASNPSCLDTRCAWHTTPHLTNGEVPRLQLFPLNKCPLSFCGAMQQGVCVVWSTTVSASHPPFINGLALDILLFMPRRTRHILFINALGFGLGAPAVQPVASWTPEPDSSTKP